MGIVEKEQALEEQHNECAYTGLWLGEGTTQTIHLDHFRKKGIYAPSTFDYGNLFAAAKNSSYGSDYKDGKSMDPGSMQMRNMLHSGRPASSIWNMLFGTDKTVICCRMIH